MPFNIEDFKARGLNEGGSRPSLFQLQLEDWPGANPGVPEKFSLLCRASTVPQSLMESVQVPYFGRTVKVVGDRVYPNWSVTFMNDKDYVLRKAFQNWHYALNSEVENLQSTELNLSSYPTGYKTNIKIIHYDRRGNTTAYYTLVGAFPVAVEQIPIAWDAVNQVEEFDVEFAYDYWLPYEITGSADTPPNFNLNPPFL